MSSGKLSKRSKSFKSIRTLHSNDNDCCIMKRITANKTKQNIIVLLNMAHRILDCPFN